MTATPTNSTWQRLKAAVTRQPVPDGRPCGRVLLYHRVAALERDPQRLAVSPERFARHLEMVLEHGVPLALDELLARAAAGTLPRGAVALTFDDGYADNLETAAPLLARHGIPATVFVATSTLDVPREFWWDELEQVLLSPGRLPESLCLPIGAEVVEYRLGHDAVYSQQQHLQNAAWTVNRGGLPSARHRVYVDLCARLRRLTASGREQAIDQLAAHAGVTLTARATHRPLSAADVGGWSKITGLTIGSHTVSHPSLAALDGQEQRSEIARGRTRLEQLTGRRVTALAYPFGGSADVSETTIEMARQSGVTLACTTTPGLVGADTPALEVPRQIVRDWNAAEFLRRWQAWTAA